MKKQLRNLQELGSSVSRAAKLAHTQHRPQPGTLILDIYHGTFLGAVKMLQFLLSEKEVMEKQGGSFTWECTLTLGAAEMRKYQNPHTFKESYFQLIPLLLWGVSASG